MPKDLCAIVEVEEQSTVKEKNKNYRNFFMIEKVLSELSVPILSILGDKHFFSFVFSRVLFFS